MMNAMISLRRFCTTSLCRAAVVKPQFPRTKPHFNVCTVGYRQHGKTTLTAAITKVLHEKNLADEEKMEDLLKTSKEREEGVTINPAIVDYFTEKRHYAHWDCPSHSRYVKNSFSVILQMKSAIFVTSIADNSLEKTRESLLFLRHLGLEDLVVFLNKIDLQKDALSDHMEMLQALIEDSGFKCGPIVAGSALKALEGKDDEIGKNSILKLLDAMDTHIKCPSLKPNDPVLLPINRVYQVKSATVVSGILKQGKLTTGMEIELLGYGTKLTTKIAGLETFDKILDEGLPGDQVFAMLSKVDRDEVTRGMVLAQPKTCNLYDHIEVECLVLTETEAKTIPNYSLLQMYSNTWETSATLILSNDEEQEFTPGKTTRAIIQLDKSTITNIGDYFILYNGKDIVCTGIVKKILPNCTQEQKQATLKAMKQKKKDKKASEMHVRAKA